MQRKVRTIKKIFNTTVSVKEGASRSVLRGIIQYDTLNEVNIRLSDGSKAFDYTGYTNIIFKVLKADSTAYIDSEGENVIATSPVDGIVTVNLAGQATTAAGLCQSVIEIYSGEDKMTTARFNYEVFENLDLDEAEVSQSQYPVFQNLMADLSALEAAIEGAEAARVDAEAARVAAEAARVTAEAVRADEATGYVAKAEAAKNAASVSAATAEAWAKQAKAVSGGKFAPDGYGLGDQCIYVDSWNNAVKNGWYRSNNDSPDGQWWFGIVVNHSNDFTVQRVWNVVAGGRFLSAERAMFYGVWQEWEYVNPRMLVGVEYRTTERYMGKPVYTKLVSLGTSVAGEMVIKHGIADIQYVCDFRGFRENMALPMIYGNSLADRWSCYIVTANKTEVTIYVGSSAAGAGVSCILKYTKTTDT